MSARCHAHQTVRLIEFSSAWPDLKLSIWSVARAFDTDHSAVKRALLRRHKDPIERALVESTAKKVYHNKGVDRTELLNYCIANFGAAIMKG
jgi:hypothetical protein